MAKKSKNNKRLIDTSLIPSTQQPDLNYYGKIRSFDLRKAQALELLNGTQMPSNFKFRENQLQRIDAFIKSCIKGQKKGFKFLMITGSPGAGKTLSANSVLKEKQYDIIKLNANVIKKISEVQEQISQKLLGDSVERTALQIVRQLEQIDYKKICIVYIEQIQVLFQSAPEIISEDFLMLFSRKNLNIILIGISNTVNTLNKYCNKLAFKIQDIQNIVFTPYNAEQIAQILKQKLQIIKSRTDIEIQYPDKLMKFTAQKLQTLRKGDFRICLQFLKQIVTLVFNQHQNQQQPQKFIIQIDLINKIFNKMNISKNAIMQTLPHQQQMILIALFNIIKKTEALWITIKELQPEVQWICKSLQICYSRTTMQNGLKQLEHKTKQIKFFLKVSLTDVECTYSDHFIFKKFFQLP